MDCTPKCRLVKHTELILSAITKEDAAKIRAILPRVCSNFARVTDQFGRSALHLAASCGKGDILEWLVKDQAVDVGFKDLESGWTALHRSVFYGYLDCTVKLIQLGSDLGCFDKESLSPLDLIRLDSPFQIATGIHAQVVSSYGTALEDELQLEVGDVVKDIHMTDARYWTGNLKGRRGHFPKDCVKLLLEEYPLELFTWGSNTNFTLGHRDESTRYAPELLESVPGDPKVCIKEVVMCKFHSAFLSMDGKVFTCGHGRGGRLGHGNEETLLVLQQVKALQEMNCVSIAAGEDHTVVVTDHGSVYTFGLNVSHQLGHSPPPKQCLFPKMVQLKLWKSKDIVGVAAGRYHSVFFTRHEVYTCGLNAGQLGHPKGDKYQTLPHQVSGLADKDVVISKVTCSDGATVCATDKGDIFLLNQYTCRKIISRFTDLTQLAVIGGELDMISPLEVSKKFADELAVTLLNSRGQVFQWKPKFSTTRECYWCHNRPITVRDFSIGKQLLIVSDDGEAFVCQPKTTKSSPLKTDSNRISRSPSISKSTESTLAQSPPTFSPLSYISKEKDETLAHSFPNTTPLSLLVKDKAKKDTVVEYCLERIPLVHRGRQIFTDSKSRGFAVLQVASVEGLQKLPQVSPVLMSEQLIQLLEEATCDDDIHDVEFIIKGQTIPAHGFVLASRSPKCHQLICENKENCSKVTDKKIRTIKLNDSVVYSEVIHWLKRLYSGGNVSDRELFLLKEVPPSKGKNGYRRISKNKHEKKVPTQTDKTVKQMKGVLGVDGKNAIQDCLLADLVFLSKRDLDDFSAPTFDVDDTLLDSVTGDFATEKIRHNKSLELKDPVRNRNKADLPSWRACESLKFSRLNCPELYDVVIVSEDGTELKCHKCILVARLEYFRSMLASGWLESSEQSKTLKLPFPTVILEVVLDFLYSGQAGKVEEITDLELLGNILIVADQLLIGRLREICEAVIANLVTLRNVSELLEFSLLYNANQLRDVCTEYICNNLGSLMEARTLDSFSDEALREISKAYRNMVPRMAWRMITSSDLHTSICLDSEAEPSPGKRRRSTGRKKSSKSESEQDVGITETVQEETGTEEIHRTSVQETEEVFLQQHSEESETAEVGKNGEDDALLESTKTDEQTTQEHQVSASQTGDAGMWYRKESPESTKSKKKGKRHDSSKFAQDSEAKLMPQKSETTAKKVPSPEKPAWSKPSVSSPPSTSLKDIIEQEQSQVSSDLRSAKKVTFLPRGSDKKHLPMQSFSIAASSQGRAFRWNSGGRQSQKQRKRSKSNTSDESGDQQKRSEGTSNDAADTEKEERRPLAWGGINKEPAPVQSLRDLMQEEEQNTNFPSLTPTPKIPVAPVKSGSARKKLNWRPQPGFYANNLDPDAHEAADTEPERELSVPSSPPKSAWQSNPIACSPPSSSVAFCTILETQEQENTNLNEFSRKPFHLTQLEERAMEELLQYYGGKDNACEFVTVERIPSTAAKPVWKKDRSPSLTSS
ncbi:inhibitor of Bruton tyrosine kinase-like isoform X1 [Oculina patagonica]